MTTQFNIGDLYQLNPKYGHEDGKVCYLSSQLEKSPHHYEDISGFVDPSNFDVQKIYVKDPLLLLEKDVRYIHLKPFTTNNFIKILVKNQVLSFPYTLYQKDILIQYQP